MIIIETPAFGREVIDFGPFEESYEPLWDYIKEIEEKEYKSSIYNLPVKVIHRYNMKRLPCNRKGIGLRLKKRR